MRIPDELLECVTFMAVERNSPDGKHSDYRGTGFFVGVPSSAKGVVHVYLITAKHCVLEAGADLHIRLNTKGGGSELVKISPGEWIFHADPGVDVAVRAFGASGSHFEYKFLPSEMILTDAMIEKYYIGIGDELYLTGLFVFREGGERNRPIVRAGMIADMPNEPFVDPKTAASFRAYLVEARSIGGLSGSPVYVFIDRPRRQIEGPSGVDYRGFLLGLVRGHWDYKSLTSEPTDELRVVNMGLAMVTPIQLVSEILHGNTLKEQRRVRDEEILLERASHTVND